MRHLEILGPAVRIVVLTDSGAIPSFYVRLLDPLEHATKNYNVVHSSGVGAGLLAAEADVVVLQRWFNTPIRRLAEQAKRRGVPVVYETDDNLLDLAEGSSVLFSPEQIENMRAVMKLADLITCSTEPLAEALRQFNPNVLVLPNYGLSKPAVDQSGPAHLAIVNTDYFKIDQTKHAFFEALRRAIVSWNYHISFIGSIDSAALDLQAQHPESVSLMDYQTDDRSQFLDRLAASGANVAAIPLSDSRQHCYKSDIKFLDFASIGIPGIYNNQQVYPEVVSGVNGLICEDSTTGWADALNRFADPGLRRSCAVAAREMVQKNRSLESYAARLGDAYARLVSGTSGADIAGVKSAAGSEQRDASDGSGLLWRNGHLVFISRGRERGVASLDLVPTLLNSGQSFLDPEMFQDRAVLTGAPLTSRAEIKALIRSRVSEAPRRSGGRALQIAWIVPDLIIGGGGHRNIIRCAYRLEKLGHTVSLYFVDTAESSESIERNVHEHFYPFEGIVGRLDDFRPSGDVVLATHWSTMKYAESLADWFGEIMYFVQDFEPSFYAMGSEYILAEATYRRGHYAITSGVWCEQFLRQQFGAEADHFRFPIDTSVYYSRPQRQREERLLFFAKPEMNRRCFELGTLALQEFHALRPDVQIGFYGSSHAANISLPFPVTHFGLLSGPNDLAELYSSSAAGLVFSTTNPSLVPYEMMACGLPVIDLNRPGNEANYGGRFDIARLVDPDPRLMAQGIADLLDRGDELEARSKAGLSFAAEFPTEEEVGSLIEGYILGRVAAWTPGQHRRAQVEPRT